MYCYSEICPNYSKFQGPRPEVFLALLRLVMNRFYLQDVLQIGGPAALKLEMLENHALRL